MGTHPIFESDFDCLTDREMLKVGQCAVLGCRSVVHQVRTRDGRLCVLEDVGNRASEKAVIFLPGALGSLKTDFEPQFADESPFQKYRLICFEPSGYGRSRPPARTWPSANFLQRDAADLGHCLKELGDDRYNLIGWSDGGITALCLASLEEYRDNVEKIVIWGSNATMSERDREMYLAMRDVSAWSARMRAGYESVYGDEFPALWAAWIDGFIEYLGTCPFRPFYSNSTLLSQITGMGMCVSGRRVK